MKLKLKKLRNQKNKNLLIALFIFSVAIHAYNVFSSQRVSADPLIQIGTAVSFLDGNGFSVLSTTDFIEIEKSKVTSWPYFYRILAMPVLILTKSDIELTVLSVSVISFALFLFCLLVFINRLSINNKYTISLMVCLFIPFVTSPLKYGSDIDWLTLGVSLLSLIYVINYWYKKQSLKNIILFSLLIALLPQMRYAYIPQAIVFLLFFVLIHVFSDKKIKNWVHYIAFTLPISSLIYTTQLPYFSSTTSMVINRIDPRFTALENFQLWLKPFYAPFFNSFFPDYILFSFLKRFSFYEDVVVFIMGIFMIISFIFFFIIIKRYLLNVKGIKDLFKESKIFETGLIMIISTTLIFYVLINRNKVYPFDEISSGLFLLKSLSTFNRYLIPLHVSTILLTLIYAFSNKKFLNFFKALLYTSISFGLLHYSYLRIIVYSPFDRSKNMNIVNNPAGSYNDILEIGDFLYNEKKTNKVFFLSSIDRNDENYRQIKPYFFAVANAVIIVPEKTLAEGFLLKENEVLLRTVRSTETLSEKKWELNYEGKIYSLYKFKQ